MPGRYPSPKQCICFSPSSSSQGTWVGKQGRYSPCIYQTPLVPGKGLYQIRGKPLNTHRCDHRSGVPNSRKEICGIVSQAKLSNLRHTLATSTSIGVRIFFHDVIWHAQLHRLSHNCYSLHFRITHCWVTRLRFVGNSCRSRLHSRNLIISPKYVGI